MKSEERRRPKPPPLRMMWSTIFSFGMPKVVLTRAWPAPGFWVGAQSSRLPSAGLNRAVQFCGSMLACEMKG